MKKNKKMVSLALLSTATVLTLVGCSEKETDKNEKKKENEVKVNEVLIGHLSNELIELSYLKPVEAITSNDSLSRYTAEGLNMAIDTDKIYVQMNLDELKSLNDADLTEDEKKIKEILIKTIEQKLKMYDLIDSIELDAPEGTMFPEHDINKEGFKDQYKVLYDETIKLYKDNYELLGNYIAQLKVVEGKKVDNVLENLEADYLINHHIEDEDDNQDFDTEVLNKNMIGQFVYDIEYPLYDNETVADKETLLKEAQGFIDGINKTIEKTKATKYYKENKEYKAFVDLAEKEINSIDYIALLKEAKYEDLYLDLMVMHKNIDKFISERYLSDMDNYTLASSLYLVTQKPDLLRDYLSGKLSENVPLYDDEYGEETIDLEETPPTE